VTAPAGSLCSGVGMLDRAIETLFDVSTAWFAEMNPAAATVYAHHWPGLPNLGDITAVNWGDVDPVRLLKAGFPCQPFSAAGRRDGSADERHLWPTAVLPAITTILPPVVVLENVPGLLRIEHGQVWGQVLADLDRLGYTVAWTTVGACKVGACHHRHRLFVLAVRDTAVPTPDVTPSACRQGEAWAPVQDVLFGDTESVRWPDAGMSRAGVVWPLPAGVCANHGVLFKTPTSQLAINGGSQHPDKRKAGGHGPTLADEVEHLLPTPRATDTGTPGRRAPEGFRPPLSQVLMDLLPTPRVSADRTGRSAITGSSSSPSLAQALEIAAGVLPRELRSWEEAPPAWQPAGSVDPGRFGRYEAAVRRHEQTFGLPAPEPTEPIGEGQPRLSVRFVEWMMGLPAGYVTDLVSSGRGRPEGMISRNDAMKALGNGVFGPAATHALMSLPTFGAAQALLAARPLAVAA